MTGLLLEAPNTERDARFAAEWFRGEVGKTTLRLMGNLDDASNYATLEAEELIISDFINAEKEGKQLTWMIRYQDKTVGSVWVELEDTEYVMSPALHIMIGDPKVRGKGIGEASCNTVIDYISSQKYPQLYSRHLTNNKGASGLLATLGFTRLGNPYQDNDGLNWQNVRLGLTDRAA